MQKDLLSRVCTVVIMAFAVSLIIGGMGVAEDQGIHKSVNLNEATVKELAKLPGIGKKKAEAIIAHRSEHGRFNSVDDLKKVDGIGRKIFEKVKDRVAVEGG